MNKKLIVLIISAMLLLPIFLSAERSVEGSYITVDPSLIGGFLIKTESKVIDFTIKNQLQKLAKHLDTVLEI